MRRVCLALGWSPSGLSPCPSSEALGFQHPPPPIFPACSQKAEFELWSPGLPALRLGRQPPRVVPDAGRAALGASAPALASCVQGFSLTVRLRAARMCWEECSELSGCRWARRLASTGVGVAAGCRESGSQRSGLTVLPHPLVPLYHRTFQTGIRRDVSREHWIPTRVLPALLLVNRGSSLGPVAHPDAWKEASLPHLDTMSSDVLVSLVCLHRDQQELEQRDTWCFVEGSSPPRGRSWL